MINDFKMNGYVYLPNIIPVDDLMIAHDISLTLKNHVIDQNMLTKPKHFGAPIYSRSLDMASKLNDTLEVLYKRDWLVNIAKQLLECDSVYLFNDQVVVKLAHEEFLFPEHTDNFFGPDPEAAKRGEFKTITCCWVLDDFTEFNGPVSILNTATNEWDTTMAKAGDLLIWDGNTVHKSGINNSETARCVWLQIYATHDISVMKNINQSDFVSPVNFTRYHSIKL